MIEHNVVVVGGLEYKAVSCYRFNPCKGCHLMDADCQAVDCNESSRDDGSTVRFKRHYRPKHNELPIKVIEL